MIVSFFTTLFTAPLDLIYWIKWAIAYTCIRYYNAFHRRRFDNYDLKAFGDPVKMGLVYPQLERDLESPFPESHLQECEDEVLFYGVNSKSECLLVRVARGVGQVADTWIYLKLADGKIYHLAESAGHQQSFDEGGKCHNFSCGKLQMHYLAPMRRWRIFYCGMLNETSGSKSEGESSIFVKFVFLWKCSSDVYDRTVESNPDGFANAMAKSEWSPLFVPPVTKTIEATNFYAQSGTMNGTVSIDEGDDHEMYLFGEKMRNIGKTTNIVGCKYTNIMGNTPENGFTFHVGKMSAPYTFNNLPYGFAARPDAPLGIAKEVDINIQHQNGGEDKTLKAVFSAGGSYEVKGKVIGDPIVLYSGQGWGGCAEASFIEFAVGDKKGSGLIIVGEVSRKSNGKSKLTTEKDIRKIVPLTVPFTDEMSQFRDISGGKGASLGKLTKLSDEDETFTVPKGIVVTTSAYKNFLTPEILSAVKNLENVVYENVAGNSKETCQKVSDLVARTILPAEICQSITKDLKQLFGDEVNQRRFAIRSSATGEDSAAMSAAGQMDTFLGIQGLDNIFLAVKKCWASQFGHIAVEYKRRYGQVLNSPMAVVIQEMVSCEVSGVLFTCDPVTNNPLRITITANYGLGETVVSGSVEPDTITLRRNVGGNLEFDSVLVGAKRQKMVMQESGGTVIEDIPEDSRRDSCLPTELAERLGKLSLKIEKCYRSSLDIEWGIVKGSVFILQARPVTSAAAETEFEVRHEFDVAIGSENEYLTVANVGEVMPGAISPLGLDLTLRYFGNLMKREAIEKGFADISIACPYLGAGFLVFCNHLMLTVAEMVIRYGIGTPMSKGFMISIFGRVLDDPDLLEYAYGKVPPGYVPKLSIRQNIQYYWDLYTHDWGFEKVKEKYEKYPLNFLKHKTAKDTFEALIKSCSDFDEIGTTHLISSGSSSNWNMSMFQVLCDAKQGRFDTDVYGDFARLLSTSSNVESANVPQALQEVAAQISKDIQTEKFKSMSNEEALQWLEKSTSLAGYKFRQFIKRHGHRCIKEFDVLSKTWEMDPESLVTLLQNLTGNAIDTGKKEEEDYDQIFSELHVPLGFKSKCRLKFVLPNCRRAVRAREACKSICVKCMGYWRKGYVQLGKQMASEGRIPESDLIFFFSVHEIKDLLETRNPSIISRAINRKRMFPAINKYKFPEIMRGTPRPVNESDENYEFVADLAMKGIPVSQGVVKGYARVAVTIEEAAFLKKGEILITYSTDIGWSPYFPIIAGVVTEIGGLISHGAVVSREYGLPCVVGLQGVTKRFQTGDYVLLDGKKGILQRLPQPEQ